MKMIRYIFCFIALHNTELLAIFIPISNAGFESDGPLPLMTYKYGRGIPTDWKKYDPTGGLLGVGITREEGGTSYSDPIFGDKAPEGNITVYIEQEKENQNGNGEIGIEQTLTGHAVTAETTYILSVYVGSGSSTCYSSHSTDGEICADMTGFPGYRVQLLAGDSILTEDDDTLNITDGTWQKSTVTIDIHSGDNNIGKTLQIRLINKNIARENTVSDVVDFDDVTLEAVPITIGPTAFPSQLPTKQPTDPPISMIISSTVSPTELPSISPQNEPTFAPSTVPTEGSIVYSTETQTIETNTKNGDDSHTQKKATWPMYIIILMIVFDLLFVAFCASIVYIGYKCYSRRNAQRMEANVRKNIGHKATISSSDENRVKKRVIRKDEEVIKLLFEHDLQLPQYYAAFIENGYDSIKTIAIIQTKQQLTDMGITMAGHQKLILAKVEELCKSTERGDDLNTTDVQLKDGDDFKLKNRCDTLYELEEIMKRDRILVEEWFDDSVGLARYKYHELFIENGYESLKAIQSINDKAELQQIGVTILGHQALIFSEIDKLNRIDERDRDSLPLYALQQLPGTPHVANIKVEAIEEGIPIEFDKKRSVMSVDSDIDSIYVEN